MISVSANVVNPPVRVSDNPADPDSAADRLKAARERAGLSQREAAVALGVHYGSLNRYEMGRMRVPADLLMRAEAMWADASTPATRAEERADGARDPNEEMPGFWLGYLSAAHKMIAQGNAIVAQGNSIIQEANSHLAVMLAAGSRWEHATVMATMAPEPDPQERVTQPFDWQPAPRPESPPARGRRRA